MQLVIAGLTMSLERVAIVLEAISFTCVTPEFLGPRLLRSIGRNVARWSTTQSEKYRAKVDRLRQQLHTPVRTAPLKHYHGIFEAFATALMVVPWITIG